MKRFCPLKILQIDTEFLPTISDILYHFFFRHLSRQSELYQKVRLGEESQQETFSAVHGKMVYLAIINTGVHIPTNLKS